MPSAAAPFALPLRVEPIGGRYKVYDASGKIVAEIYVWREAAYIVRAVNAHQRAAVVTCPECGAAPRVVIEDRDDAGVSSWYLADRCSDCLETALAEVDGE